MRKRKYFKSATGRIPLPAFFPDATRAVVKTVDSQDLKNTKTPGVLVNTYHLYSQLGSYIIKKHGGIKEFMGWDGAVISDSGGFQVMSLDRSNEGSVKVSTKGMIFISKKGDKVTLTPEESIKFQMQLKTDMVVALDDFGTPGEAYENSKKSMERTIEWAYRSKKEFERICKRKKLDRNSRPYILGVAQGGDYGDLRRECVKRLIEIGFDGIGYGGWTANNKRMLKIAKVLAEETPKDYFLFGLGVGKPDDIVYCAKQGFNIFDCVLPTRDARHRRLYVYNATSINEIDITKPKFYSFFVPDKQKYANDKRKVSCACDCSLCTKYTRGYLFHLFKINELTALRLATIHNLRFYSLLMEKLRGLL